MRKIVSATVFVLLLWLAFSFGAGAMDGSGSANDPYLIKSESDLRELSRVLSEDDNYENFCDKHYRLENNLTLHGNFTPIGNEECSFQGVFDGGYHTISGLVVAEGYLWNGLFGVISGDAKILCLTVKNANIATAPRGGGSGVLIGCAYSGTTVENCTLSGNCGAIGIDDGAILKNVKCTSTAHTHNWGEWVTTQAATCTEAGTQTRSCPGCSETQTQQIPATGHKAGTAVEENTIPATCEATGNYDSVICCTVCHTELSREKKMIPAKGHSFGAWTTTQEATCTETGAKTRTCANCGATESETIPAKGHSFGAWMISQDATCDEIGEKVRTCAKCDAKEIETVPAKGHTWSVTTTDATCTADGKTTRTCLYCGTKETEKIPASGHVGGQPVQESTSGQSCGSDSYDEVVYCTVCGEELSRERIVSGTLDHDWSEYTVTAEPTCIAGGTKTRTCARCGEIETVTIPRKDHTPAADPRIPYEEVVAATCTADGHFLRITYCENCDAEISRETVAISAKGHTFDETVVTAADCLHGGQSERTCRVCGFSESVDTPALGHLPKDEGTPATCTTDGFSHVVCERCGVLISEETLHAPGHTPSEERQEGLKAATCTAEGFYNLTVRCTVCNEILSTEDVTIPPLGHLTGDEVRENETVATCSSDGGYDSVCYCVRCEVECSRIRTVVGRTGHTAGRSVRENVIAATCTADGSYDLVRYCTVCGAECDRFPFPISRSGHTPGLMEKEYEIPATCTDEGEVGFLRRCTLCGEIVDRSVTYKSRLQHRQGDSILTKDVKPTCTQDGYREYTVSCMDCGCEIVRMGFTVEARGHKTTLPVLKNERDAGLFHGGSADRVIFCAECGEVVASESVLFRADNQWMLCGIQTGAAVSFSAFCLGDRKKKERDRWTRRSRLFDEVSA